MARFESISPVVSVKWLNEHLSEPRVVVLDASYGTEAREFIPGAIRFDFDKTICDQNSKLPHMMPSAELFEREVRKLGIMRDSLIVVYDANGIFSSARGRLMFKAMGHKNVAILDGGLPAWREAGFKLVEAHATPAGDGDFESKEILGVFCDAETVESALNSADHVVVDARSRGRYLGLDPEPREGLRRGHMPGALNLPFGDLLTNGRMKPVAQLEASVSNLAQKDKHLIFSCGSGVTACITALAAELAGYEKVSVYDGSWSEWGLPSPRLVEK